MFEDIISKYKSGYYNYVITITFKPDSVYATAHPRKAHELFTQRVTKYCRRKSVNYYINGEIGKNGDYHIHGIFFFKSTDYDKHEIEYRLFKNWLNRSFGRNFSQRIYSLTDQYTAYGAYDWKRLRPLKTSFENIWKYINKDKGKFAFLKTVMNI